MGANFPYNIYEALAELPNAVKAELIIHLTKSMVAEPIRPIPDIRDRPPVPGLEGAGKAWYSDTPKPSDLTAEEQTAALKRLSGAWKDVPDDMINEVLTGRTISTREFDFDE